MSDLALTWQQQGRLEKAEGLEVQMFRAPEGRGRRETPRYSQSHVEPGINLVKTRPVKRGWRAPDAGVRASKSRTRRETLRYYQGYGEPGINLAAARPVNRGR